VHNACAHVRPAYTRYKADCFGAYHWHITKAQHRNPSGSRDTVPNVVMYRARGCPSRQICNGRARHRDRPYTTLHTDRQTGSRPVDGSTLNGWRSEPSSQESGGRTTWLASSRRRGRSVVNCELVVRNCHVCRLDAGSPPPRLAPQDPCVHRESTVHSFCKLVYGPLEHHQVQPLEILF
jgi:hypothetical protein